MSQQDAYDVFHAMLLVAYGLQRYEMGDLLSGGVQASMQTKYPKVNFDKAFREAKRDVLRHFGKH